MYKPKLDKDIRCPLEYGLDVFGGKWNSRMQFPQDMESQRRLLRSLMNVCYPGKHLNPEYLRLQDELLAEEREERGVVDVMELPLVNTDSRISVWQGDITRLRADAIVNAANSQMPGCFIPCHACIDNAIHSAAGLQFREECMGLMREQGFEEPVGRAKITKGYNLTVKYVLHRESRLSYNAGAENAGCVRETFRRLLKSMENGNMAEK